MDKDKAGKTKSINSGSRIRGHSLENLTLSLPASLMVLNLNGDLEVTESKWLREKESP